MTIEAGNKLIDHQIENDKLEEMKNIIPSSASEMMSIIKLIKAQEKIVSSAWNATLK